MKKILLIAAPLILMAASASAQSRPGWAKCSIGSTTLFNGTQCPGNTTCVRAQGTADESNGQYGTGCGNPQDILLIPQIAGDNTGNNPANQTGTKTNPCLETLVPKQTNQTISWLNILERMRGGQTTNENKKNIPLPKAYPLPAGPAVSGFINPQAGCAMSLAQPGPGAATQIPAADLANYNACRQQGRLIDCATALYKALENNPDFTEILKKKCPALPPNTNASVIDAIWNFVTHKRR